MAVFALSPAFCELSEELRNFDKNLLLLLVAPTSLNSAALFGIHLKFVLTWKFRPSADSSSWSQPVTSGDFNTPRVGHTMTPAENRVFVFGGSDGYRAFNDLQIFDLGAPVTLSRPVAILNSFRCFQKP